MEIISLHPEDVSPLASLLITTRADLFERARTAWPGVLRSKERFFAHVASKLSDPSGIDRLHTDDLYLACACADASPRAHESFEERCMPAVDSAVLRLRGGADVLDDTRQLVREIVLLPRNGVPRIADFSGRSPLSAWLRVIAVREAVRLLQQRRPDTDEAALAEAIDPGPELAYFKALYRTEFRAALTEAISRLTARERLLLRQNALDGVTIDGLAALFEVHRATAARWLATARGNLLSATRDILQGRLQVSPGELESILRLIQSQLDVSLRTLLPS